MEISEDKWSFPILLLFYLDLSTDLPQALCRIVCQITDTVVFRVLLVHVLLIMVLQSQCALVINTFTMLLLERTFIKRVIKGTFKAVFELEGCSHGVIATAQLG